MIIEKIHIISFGKLSDMTLELSDGINIIEGKNESGKSTISAFIKFIFYGLSPSEQERERSISWSSSCASGSVTLREGQDTYRIEREAVAVNGSDGKTAYRERCTVIDAETGKPLYKGKVPGEIFFGIPRGVFESTAFIGQLEGSQTGGKTLAEATENILFSADETVNTKKALKKLDDARVYLCHKNRKGGKIYEYSRERTELAQKLTEAQEVSASIISLEGSLRTLTEAHEKSARALERVNAEIQAYERYLIKQNYLRLRDENAKSDRAAAELKKLAPERYGMSEEKFIASLEKDKYELVSLSAAKKSAENEREASASSLERMKADFSAHIEVCGDEMPSELAEKEERAIKTMSASKKAIVFSIILAAVAVIGAVFFLPAAAAALVGVIIAAIAGAKYVSAKKTAALIYGVFGARNHMDFYVKLENLKKEEAAIAFTENINKESEKKYAAADKAYEEKKALTERKLTSKGFSLMPETDDSIISAIAAVRKEHEHRMAVMREKADADAKIKEIVTILDSVPDAEKDKAVSSVFDEEFMKKFDIRAKKRESDFLIKSISAQKEKIHSVECELASLGAVHARPAEIAQAINALNGKIDELSEKHEAYLLAIDAINAASGKLREGVSPQIAKSASAIMESLSEGKYDRVFVDRDFDITYSAGGITRDISTLSAGTSDIAYLSLRIALAQTLCKHKLPPFIFDESFTRLDNERLCACLKLLETSIGKSSQAIVFTCHEREGTLAKNTVKSTLLSI